MRICFNLAIPVPARALAPAIPAPATKARSPGEIRPWTAILLGFLALSMTGSILIDSEIEGLYHAVFYYFGAPLFVVSLVAAWFLRPRDQVSHNLMKRFGGAGLCAICLLFTCGGIANYANALSGKGEAVRFSGPVTKLDYTTGKGGARYYVIIRDESTQRRAKFQISLSDYSRLKTGDHFDCSMKLGGLGYGYRWNL